MQVVSLDILAFKADHFTSPNLIVCFLLLTASSLTAPNKHLPRLPPIPVCQKCKGKRRLQISKVDYVHCEKAN